MTRIKTDTATGMEAGGMVAATPHRQAAKPARPRLANGQNALRTCSSSMAAKVSLNGRRNASRALDRTSSACLFMGTGYSAAAGAFSFPLTPAPFMAPSTIQEQYPY